MIGIVHRNALNIVKDDLIVKVDELTVEGEILREKLNAMTQSRSSLREKITELEEELRKTKEAAKQQSKFHGCIFLLEIFSLL